MNYKKNSIIIFSSIVVLAVAAVIVIYQYMGSGTKEVKAAKKFIGLLYAKDIVVETEDYDKMSFNTVQKAGGSSEKVVHSVETRDFGIDLDDKYNVVGFISKVSKIGDTVVSEEEAVRIAERYSSIIYKESLEFKDIVKTEGETPLPYYKVVFSKYDGGYPFYNDEVVIYVDKASGKLDGYTNISIQLEPKKVKIDVKSEEAEKTAMEDFSKLNSDVKIEVDTYLAYANSKDNSETELAYIITLLGKDVNSKDVRYKYFISTQSGKIMNSQKDTVKATITNS